jgi:hypothetical protein
VNVISQTVASNVAAASTLVLALIAIAGFFALIALLEGAVTACSSHSLDVAACARRELREKMVKAYGQSGR